MANKTKRIVGLDIGTSKVLAVVVDVMTDGQSVPRYHVVGVGRAPSRGLRKGVVIHIDGTVASIGEAIAQAESMTGEKISTVAASVSGCHVQCMNSHGIVGIRDKEVSAFDIQKVIEAARAVAIPEDREVLHVLPRGFAVDDQVSIKDPLGMSGVRLESRVHIVTCASSAAENVVKCANRRGLAVDDVVLAPLASAWGVVTPEEQELGCCVLDIGAGTCGICVFQDGAVVHSSVLPIGGNHITNDIAAGLRTPIAAADEIKRVYGTVLSSSVRADETIQVPSTGGRSPRMLSRSILSEIITPRVVELFELVKRELEIAGVSFTELTSGIVLTGGTSQLHGIVPLAEDLFSTPVRQGLVEDNGNFKVSGLHDLIDGPDSATVMGIMHCGVSTSLQSRFSPSRTARDWFNKVRYWMAEHF